MSNCWIKWEFDFVIIKDYIEQLPLVDVNKLDKLYDRIDKECCTPHDLAFENGWYYFDFLKANYIFSRGIVRLLNWTSFYGKLAVFIMAFLWTTIFGKKAFNFKK